MVLGTFYRSKAVLFLVDGVGVGAGEKVGADGSWLGLYPFQSLVEKFSEQALAPALRPDDAVGDQIDVPRPPGQTRPIGEEAGKAHYPAFILDHQPQRLFSPGPWRELPSEVLFVVARNAQAVPYHLRDGRNVLRGVLADLKHRLSSPTAFPEPSGAS